MSRQVRYAVERDAQGRIVDLVRFIEDEKEIRAERYTSGQWEEHPSLFHYEYDPPAYHEWIDEAQASAIIAAEGHLL
jgi:hypothetical protein